MKAARILMIVTIAMLVAGCSTRSGDQIVGTWQSDNDRENQLAFYDNGTYASLYDVNGTTHVAYDGSWKALNNSEYQLFPNVSGQTQVLEFKYMNGKLYNRHNIDHTFSRA
jgi:glyoxylate utilization-related uncharacterized protein